MSDTALIFIGILSYLIISASIITAIDSNENSIDFFDKSLEYKNEIDYTLDNVSNYDYSFNANNAIVYQNSSGLGIDIINDINTGYIKYTFSNDYILSSTDEVSGYYEYTITKIGNELIEFYPTDITSVYTFTLFVENDNFYFNHILFQDEILYTGLGNEFTIKFEYDEVLAIYNIYANDKLVKIINTEESFGIALATYIQNVIKINDETVFIKKIESSSDEINSDNSGWFGLSEILEKIATVLIWNIPSLPWILNGIFIKLPEFCLIFVGLKAIKE